MFVQQLQCPVFVRYFRFSALPRPLFKEPFCRQNGYDNAGPVSDSVAEEGTGVRFRIRLYIEDKPERKDARRGKAERMALPERLVRFCCCIFFPATIISFVTWSSRSWPPVFFFRFIRFNCLTDFFLMSIIGYFNSDSCCLLC
jgi:hypothetical protein